VTLVHVSHADIDVIASGAPTGRASRIRFGDRYFPVLAAYHEWVAAARTAGRDAATALATAQRSWHGTGQNGCVFARIVALSPDAHWDTLVVAEPPDRLTAAGLHWIEQEIQDCGAVPDRQLVSVLFPLVTSATEAVAVIGRLAAGTGFWLDQDLSTRTERRLRLRYPVPAEAAAPVQAWVMAFGPFPFMPNTRRAPYFELVFRLRAKPDGLFHRNNPDPEVAHLADVPLTMPDHHWEHRWRSTLRRTRMVLAAEPDELTAAKMTLSVPHAAMTGADGSDDRSPGG
jgi:hypothetical protein